MRTRNLTITSTVATSLRRLFNLAWTATVHGEVYEIFGYGAKVACNA